MCVCEMERDREGERATNDKERDRRLIYVYF